MFYYKTVSRRFRCLPTGLKIRFNNNIFCDRPSSFCSRYPNNILQKRTASGFSLLVQPSGQWMLFFNKPHVFGTISAILMFARNETRKISYTNIPPDRGEIFALHALHVNALLPWFHGNIVHFFANKVYYYESKQCEPITTHHWRSRAMKLFNLHVWHYVWLARCTCAHVLTTFQGVVNLTTKSNCQRKKTKLHPYFLFSTWEKNRCNVHLLWLVSLVRPISMLLNRKVSFQAH
jgi:hypothetical protein